MKKRLARLAFYALCAALGWGIGMMLQETVLASPAPMPACTEEDGSGAGQMLPCYWDATHGNGKGQSFVINIDHSTTYH